MEIELESIHLTALLLSVIAILYADHKGYQYFTGKRERLSPRFVTWSHRLVWAGLLTMIVSGVSMVIPAWEYYLTDKVFYVKIGFVLVLVMNAFFIGKVSALATEQAYRELPPQVQKTLIVSGALSAMGWVGSAVIGFFFL